MDGDIFGAVSRLGRDAADGLGRAVAGEPWDPFLAARCLDVLLTKASGLPSLPGVLRQLDLLRAAPLFASALADSAVDAIAREVRTANGTVLDLILRAEAHRNIVRGEYGHLPLLQAFCLALLDRAIISGRGGLLEQVGHAGRRKALSVLAPVAREGAQVLIARPDAKRLRLARRHAQLDPDTDLLGGAE